MKRGVFITFDVECSMGGAFEDSRLRPVPPSRAVMGEYGDRKMGLPLITEILRENGLAATFFMEVFSEEQGYPGEAQRACQLLLDCGQDIQLHIHPCYYYYSRHARKLPYPATDDMSDLTPAQQRELLAEGCRRLVKWTGKAPEAFRAGNMGLREEDLANLSAEGITIDSSYTFPYAGGQCHFSGANPYNGSRQYGGVLELALSGFLQPRIPGLAKAKPLDLMGISFRECRDSIRRICRADADAVLILHSFSLFKVRNVQYDGGRPNRVVINRFRRLCRWLSDNRDEFPAYTFSGLARAIADKQYKANAVAPCRISGPTPLIRKAVQAYNRWYWT